MRVRTLWRRLRGLVGTVLVWAGAWTLAGLGVGLGFWISGTTFFGLGGIGWLPVWAEVGAIAGAISGGAFSLAVMALDGRREFSAIRPFRFGVLGALTAGLVLAIMAEWSLTYGLIGAAICFTCGSGSVVVARRALLPPRPELLSAKEPL